MNYLAWIGRYSKKEKLDPPPPPPPPPPVIHIVDNTGRLHQKGVPFSGGRYIKAYGFHELKYKKGENVTSESKRAFQNTSNRHLYKQFRKSCSISTVGLEKRSHIPCKVYKKVISVKNGIFNNFYSTIAPFYHIRAKERDKYTTLLHSRTGQKYGLKAERQNGRTKLYL